MTKRREFIKKSAITAMAMGLPISLKPNKNENLNSQNVIRPKRLKKGNVVGLIAPGYAISEEMLQNSITAVKKLGMEPYHTNRIMIKHGYFSNSDEERAKDLMHMFTNPNVDGIFCIRGGYGCTRILDMLDYGLIAENPKILLGYSDITALVNAFYKKTGLVGFHGAMGPEPNSYAFDCIENMLMHSKDRHIIKNYDFDAKTLEDVVYEPYVINSGMATGTLVGGNLSLLAAMTGTNYDIDYTDCIVCIEDVGEAPYRIDRMLTQLLATPTFKKASGIVFGVCKGCNDAKNPDSFSLKEVIMDRIAPMNIPAVYGMSFGHLPENFTFPIGIKATLDTNAFNITLEEKPLT